MQQLLQRKIELENEINKFEFPLFYSQVLKRDRLIKELKEVRFKIFIGEHISEQKVKAIHNRV